MVHVGSSKKPKFSIATTNVPTEGTIAIPFLVAPAATQPALCGCRDTFKYKHGGGNAELNK